MNTEEIKVNERKTLVLLINPTTDKVHRVDVYTSGSSRPDMHHKAAGISREEAIQEYS
jgi:hypothetical protein